MKMEQECFNCDVELLKCECGDTETFSEEGVVCPFCGFLHTTDGSPKGQHQRIECVECDKLIISDFNEIRGERFWLAYKPES